MTSFSLITCLKTLAPNTVTPCGTGGQDFNKWIFGGEHGSTPAVPSMNHHLWTCHQHSQLGPAMGDGTQV